MKTDTADRIVAMIEKKGSMRPTDITAQLGISPQAIHRQLKRLQEQQRIAKEGKTPHVRYVPFQSKGVKEPSRFRSLKKKRKELLNIADKYGAENVRIFGSIVRGEDTPESDIDFLVHFRKGTSLFDRGGLIVDLREYLGCDVDIVSDTTIKPELKDHILSTARPL